MITSDTPLTHALRADIRDVLVDVIAQGGEAGEVAASGAPYYLSRLDATRDGDALGDLVDVVEYFQLDQ